MGKSWSAIACALLMTPCATAQNQPRLRRVERVPTPYVRGSLAGFRPVQMVQPNLSDVGSPPDHTRVSARMVVTDGRPDRSAVVGRNPTVHEARNRGSTEMAIRYAGRRNNAGPGRNYL